VSECGRILLGIRGREALSEDLVGKIRIRIFILVPIPERRLFPPFPPWVESCLSTFTFYLTPHSSQSFWLRGSLEFGAFTVWGELSLTGLDLALNLSLFFDPSPWFLDKTSVDLIKESERKILGSDSPSPTPTAFQQLLNWVSEFSLSTKPNETWPTCVESGSER